MSSFSTASASASSRSFDYDLDAGNDSGRNVEDVDDVSLEAANETTIEDDGVEELTEDGYKAWLQSMDFNVTSENCFYSLFKDFDETKKKDTDIIINNNLFTALSVIACDTIRTGGEAEKRPRVEMAHYKFNEVYKTFTKTGNNFEKFIDYLPTKFHGEYGWPKCFNEYVKKKLDASTKTFRQRNLKIIDKDMSETKVKELQFGEGVWNTSTEAKLAVKKLNKWVVKPSDLKSGLNETSMFRSIQKKVWEETAMTQAKEYVANLMREKDKEKCKVTAEKPASEWTLQKYDEYYKKCVDSNFYPKCWLAFLFFGKPLKLQPLVSMSCGSAALPEQIRNLGSKALRRATDANHLFSTPVENSNHPVKKAKYSNSPEGRVITHKVAMPDELEVLLEF